MTEATVDEWHDTEGDRFRPFGLRRVKHDQPVGSMIQFCGENFARGTWAINTNGAAVVCRFLSRNDRLLFRMRF